MHYLYYEPSITIGDQKNDFAVALTFSSIDENSSQLEKIIKISFHFFSTFKFFFLFSYNLHNKKKYNEELVRRVNLLNNIANRMYLASLTDNMEFDENLDRGYIFKGDRLVDVVALKQQH